MALDHWFDELLAPLIPEWCNASVEDISRAVGLLACLKGGVVVGDVRIATNVSPYEEPVEDSL